MPHHRHRHRHHHHQTVEPQRQPPARAAEQSEPDPQTVMAITRRYLPIFLAAFALNCIMVLTEYRRPGLLTSVGPLRSTPRHEWAVYTLALLPFWLWSAIVCIMVNGILTNPESPRSMASGVAVCTIKVLYLVYNIVPVYLLLSRYMPAENRSVFRDASVLVCHNFMGSAMLTCTAPWKLAAVSDWIW
ncbi:hypothetical protein MGG_05162 [Pyricularia oryzae 70-15]|uniref:Uncharacterized protein n=3 Tax=Pyricularia oryzae TaxID=318829 RepID=G4N4S5_PYRO7|nr:uncharacterized protein MGG_05162 [Pyricularia oryzae 70-15]EHA52890.1 hypothetical protein MGG_05162 [Pyricularia oryzae 70-15]ELQ39010.1 hypothetical protein OOU_Y34scaffold00516g45 [Pyricularia oryzae Y34]KAI7927694.1 hypothetical protein M0657_003096 [Pyricularia oryzae]KAI7930661.1 hypothetical protein M9X92_000725 [Pyricularia oryzae]